MALAALATLATTGCAPFGSSARGPSALEAEAASLSTALARDEDSPVETGALRVRLVFGEDADLDLYVTDPLQETVYFGNNPSRAGGELESDVRCGSPAPRIETVTFREAAPGVYRVGVDFPEHCRGRREAVGFVVVVEHAGVRREQRGWIEPLRFLPIVLETAHPPSP